MAHTRLRRSDSLVLTPPCNAKLHFGGCTMKLRTSRSERVEHTKAMQNTANINAIVMSTTLKNVGYTVSSTSSLSSVSAVVGLASLVDSAISFASAASAIALSFTVAGSTMTAAFSDIIATPLGANVECAESSFDDLLDGRAALSSGTPMSLDVCWTSLMRSMQARWTQWPCRASI